MSRIKQKCKFIKCSKFMFCDCKIICIIFVIFTEEKDYINDQKTYYLKKV